MLRSTSLFLLLASVACGEIGDPTIRTDHPHYPGEGAFQSVEGCVRFATAGKESTQERAIALYQWLLTHQYHLMSPQEWCVPGRVPDTAVTGDYELVPFDANQARFSYGYGLCGTVHAWNEPYWNALGTRPRRRAFPGHVNSEIEYDGSWHAFDTDMAGLLFRKDGVVAGYDDIVRDPSLVDSTKPPLPHYPFAWPSDFETMKRGWQEVAKTTKAGKTWYSLYNSGYAAHPGIIRLRSGESFTRWYDRDHFGGPTKRRFWHHLKDGPRRYWTFLDNGEPFHNGAKSNSRGDASYCNAEFVYEPPLDSDGYREGLVEVSKNVAHRDGSPRLFASDGATASVTFQHFSPYVICGDPEDDANPMTGLATGGLVVEGDVVGEVTIAVSANEGQTWKTVPFDGRAGGFRVDLTDHVKGRYGWRVRLTWKGGGGLDRLRFTTVCQVAQGIYPRLTANGSRVSFATGSRGVVPVLPDFGVPDDVTDEFEERRLRSSNVEYTPRTSRSRLAYRTTDNRPGQVVFCVESPELLLEVRAAIRYQLRVPPPAETDYRLEVSTDDGATWRSFAKADIPADNEFSSGWLAGTVDVSNAATRHAMVRATFHAGGHRTGLIDAQFYGVYETGSPGPSRVEFGWRDGEGKRATHAVELPAGTNEKSFTIPTGKIVRDEFVRISADASEQSEYSEVATNDDVPAWVEPMRKVYAGFDGRAGYVAQFGDSITYSMAFWSPMSWDDPAKYLVEADGLPKTPAKGRWRDVVLGARDKGTKFANYSGWTVRNLIASVDEVLEREKPEMAIIMIGTNDISGGSVPKSYEKDLETVVEKCLAAHCIPILNTIPPARDRDEAVEGVNAIVRRLAKQRKIPLVDYHAEIVARRPDGTWQDTLISKDGVHPSGGRTNDYSPENLRSCGYALRNWLNFLAVREVHFRVLHPETVE